MQGSLALLFKNHGRHRLCPFLQMGGHAGRWCFADRLVSMVGRLASCLWFFLRSVGSKPRMWKRIWLAVGWFEATWLDEKTRNTKVLAADESCSCCRRHRLLRQHARPPHLCRGPDLVLHDEGQNRAIPLGEALGYQASHWVVRETWNGPINILEKLLL